jgi:hypothetical protein
MKQIDWRCPSNLGILKKNLGNISSGPIKIIIDCIYPIIGRISQDPDDWKIDLIQVEKDPSNRNPDSVKISFWKYRCETLDNRVLGTPTCSP